MTRKTSTTPVMIAILLATFMSSVETTIITTALPTIISQLHGLSLQSWVFTVYLLATAISTPIYGKFSDRIGRKPVFLVGLILFTLGSLLSGFAPSMLFLIVTRTIQGLGAGAIMPITFTIIADLFSYEQRANVLALNNTAWGISALAGPLLGGFIVDQLNWHWVFFINIPIGIVVFLLVVFTYHEKAFDTDKQPMDVGGIATISLSLISLLLLFQNLSHSHAVVSNVILFMLFLAGTLSFILIERRAADPLIPLSMFRNSTFAVQIIIALLLSGAQISFQVYFPIWLQSIYGASAATAGLAITPSPIMWLLASFLVGGLLKRWAPRTIIFIVVLIMLAAYVPILISTPRFPQAAFYVIAGFTGAGLGIIITINTIISQHLVNKDSVGVASSILTLGRTLGQTLAAGIYGLIFNRAISEQLHVHTGISAKAVDNFVNASGHAGVPSSLRPALSSILLYSLHHVFLLVLILFSAAIVVNIFDKQKTVLH